MTNLVHAAGQAPPRAPAPPDTTPPPSQETGGCKTEIQRSERFQAVAHFLKSERELWGSFRASDMNFVFIDMNQNPRCAGLVKAGEVLDSILLARPLPTPAPRTYDLLVNTIKRPNYPIANRENLSRIREFQNRGLMLCCGDEELRSGISQLLHRNGLLAATLYVFRRGPVRAEGRQDLALMLHESLHFQYQNQTTSNYAWPRGNPFDGVFGARNEICYGSDFESLLASEAKTLYRAYVKAEAGASDWKNDFRQFYRMRKRRYNNLPSIPPEKGGRGIFAKCEHHEATWEYLEGTAEYIGFEAMTQGAPAFRKTLVERRRLLILRGSKPKKATLFYYTGAMLWSLYREALGSEASFIRATKKLSMGSERTPLADLVFSELN